MNQNPRISIIVRTQNRPHLLNKALASLSRQTYTPLEVVVVNDGGKDVTAPVEPFREQFSLQLIQHDTAQGRSAAANAGLEAAAGEWFGFLDDDDTLEPDGLDILARYIPWDKDLIYGRVRVLQMAAEPEPAVQTGVFGEPFEADRLALQNYIPICGYLCRREHALDVGGFDPAFEVLEDWDFLFRLSRQIHFHYVPEIVANYCVWGTSYVSQQDPERERRFRSLFFQKHWDAFSPDLLRRATLAIVAASDARFRDVQKQHAGQLEQLRAHHHAELDQALVDAERKHREPLEKLQAHMREAAQAHERQILEYQKHAEELAGNHHALEQVHAECLRQVGQKRETHRHTLDQHKKIIREQHRELQAALRKQGQSQAHIAHLEAHVVHQENHLQQHAVRVNELEYAHAYAQALWQARMAYFTNKLTSAVPFEVALVDLQKYALTPFMQAYAGEETTVYRVTSPLDDIHEPLVLFRQKITWTWEWSGRSPVHVLSFKLATYNRQNHCRVLLEITPEDMEQGGEISAATLDALDAKDNNYAAFVLDKPLPAGKYRCSMYSPDADVHNAVALMVAPEAVELEVQVQLPSAQGVPQVPRLTQPPPETFAEWFEENRVPEEKLAAQRREFEDWDEKPRFSLLIPCYNSAPKWLEALLEDIGAQTYPEWECILVDDASPKAAHIPVIERWCEQDTRFRFIPADKNQGVSATCQTALDAAQGDYVAVVDHDDGLEPQALFELAKAARAGDADVIYSDEVLVDEREKALRCAFRPDYSYYFLLSHPYIVHLTAFRRDVLVAAGGFDRDLKVSQDYDVLLRVAAKTDKFIHVAKVLYRWRTYSRSTGHVKRDDVTTNSLEAINNHLRLKGWDPEKAWAEEGLAFNFFRVRHRVAPCKVSVIIPTRDRVELLEVCLDSFQEKTALPDGVEVEFIIVDNGSEQNESLLYFTQLRAAGHQVLHAPGPFNFSVLNNRAAEQANGDFLLFLNNDIEIVEPGWLEAMLEPMQDPGVGTVGAKLLYPDIGLIQHAGVILGFNGIAAHDHQFYAEYDELGQLDPGYNHALAVIRECLAVTAACMLVRRAAFEQVGGFDENLHVGFGDTDLSLKIVDAGYRCLFTPYARLVHHESASRGKQATDPHPIDSALFLQRWEKLLQAGDPYYNPNMVRNGVMFTPNLRRFQQG